MTTKRERDETLAVTTDEYHIIMTLRKVYGDYPKDLLRNMRIMFPKHTFAEGVPIRLVVRDVFVP